MDMQKNMNMTTNMNPNVNIEQIDRSNKYE